MKKYSIKKGEWLTEIVADREEWLELLGASPADSMLARLGIARSTWDKIAAGKAPRVPIAAYRLATFARHGELSELLGNAWRDFFVSGDTLTLPGLRQPISAQALRAVWVSLQELPTLRRQVVELRAAADWVEVSPAVAAWLRRLGKGFPTLAENF